MICDQLENLCRYPILKDHAPRMLAFINQIDLSHFQPQKIVLDGANLTVRLTEYDTRDWADVRPETHDAHYDIVILLEGKENIYLGFRRDFVAAGPYRQQEDITYYHPGEERIAVSMEPGMFLFFSPEDVHHPYCHCGEKRRVKKVTFKIRIPQS